MPAGPRSRFEAGEISMSSPQPAPVGIREFATSLNRALRLRRVLQVGENLNPVADALRLCGIEVSAAISPLDPLTSHYDLVLCGQFDLLPVPDAVAAIRNLASATNAVLCAAATGDRSSKDPCWLRALHELRFETEPLDFPEYLSPKLVLLRREAGLSWRDGELLRLREEIAALRSTLADLVESEASTAERLDGRIAQLQSTTNRVAHEVQSILNSRIWRTLVAGGSWVLRVSGLFRGARPTDRRRPQRFQEKAEPAFHIFCDEPRGEKTEAASGTIVFRGWAVASSGIDRVEIQAGREAAIPARFGLFRPDVAPHIPGVPDGDRCGFQASLDTTRFRDGVLPVVVRAFSKEGSQTEVEVPVLLDHVHGYASDYYRWIAEFEKRDSKLIQMRLESFRLQPRISILVPVYRTPPEILERTIGSVLAQSYSNWELCLADDGSQSDALDELLARHADADKRIKLVRLERNGGISKASNAALEVATGEYIGLLDHDDELAGDALYHVVHAINRDPGAEIFYSDEDHIDESGLRTDPFFKPDWSPDLILSENYVTHFMVFQASLAREAGGFRSECDLSQDHDILLRMSLKARKIVHIPRILYHWRTNVFAVDRASERNDKALATSRRAVEDYLKLAGVKATVEPGAVPGRWRVRYDLPREGWVDIIIPNGGNTELLGRCLDSVASRTEYPFYNLTVIDNSHDGKLEDFVRGWSVDGRRARIFDWRNRPFSFSVMNNAAARTCEAPLLLFLNDDTTVLEPGWLTAMVELAARPEAGAVGAKLLYPDDRIQHAGVVIGIFGLCGHGFKGAFDDQRTYFDFPDVIRNVSAVTGACLMAQAKTFWEVGGFDEEDFPIAYNDVDLCLKLAERGYRVLYTPHAKLYHYEAFSKRGEDRDPRPKEMKAFQAKWKRYVASDPFYNPNLTLASEDYSLRKKSSGR
jgi:GT2 family glycosyltransferase